VAHLARLARLAVTDAELDVFAGQLDVILGAVARVGEVAADDIPPTSHAVPLENVFRPDELRPCLTQEQALAGAPAARTAASACRRSWGRSNEDSELTRLTAVELAEKIHSREVSAVEVARAHLDRIAEVDGQVHAFLHVAEDAALASAALVDESLAVGTPPASPLAGVPLALKDVFTTIGHAHHGGLEDPRRLAPALRRHGRRAAAGGRDHHPGQDQHGRVRHGLLHRALGLRHHAQPVGPRPRARRLRRRLGGGPGRVRGAPGHRHRHRRLDPPARRVHRHGRGEAHLRRVSRYG
jgi:aspartyl/glutamyl-tRNA(Asn/Gln) amidotransferase C subunit